jgi:microcystin-dependent protein
MDPFIGEIKMFAGNFAPRGWALCDGQLLTVSQNDALFSLFGTIYGGDGRTTFGLPDMRGRVPLHQGQGNGLTDRRIGLKVGTESETLTINNIPTHNHSFQATTDLADAGYPATAVAADTDTASVYYKELPDENDVTLPDQDPDTVMPDNTLSSAGGGQAHNNLMPFQCVNYIVALVGTYPSRN